MIFFRRLMKGNGLVFLVAGLLGLASGGINARLIALVSEFIAQFGKTDFLHQWPLFAILVGAAFLTGSLTQVFMSHLSAKLTYNLRLNICKQILALPFRDREAMGKSRILAAFTEDIQALTNALLRIPNLFVNSTIAIGCLVYLGYLSWPVMAALTAFIVLGAVTYKLPEKFALKYIRKGRDAWDGVMHHFNAMLAGDKELTLNYQRRKALMDEKLEPIVEDLKTNNYKERSIYAYLTNWSRLLYFVFMGVLLFVIPRLMEINAETLIGFALVLVYVRTPIIIMLDGVPVLRRANVAVTKIEKLGITASTDPYVREQKTEIENLAHGKSTFRELKLAGVTHAYYHEREARFFKLGPVDFCFEPGQIVFIIGGNGSGKTTLAKVITGLYPPEAGEICINGMPVQAANLEAYRQNFTAIFSDFYLFEELLGLKLEREDQQANQYLEKLQLDHKVSFNQGVLSTTALSTGQRKRLALITAFLEDRPIYLFDEWAADQDPEFKTVFYRHLLPDLKAAGKLVFVISHDDRYFDEADHILKLTDGQLETLPTASLAN